MQILPLYQGTALPNINILELSIVKMSEGNKCNSNDPIPI